MICNRMVGVVKAGALMWRLKFVLAYLGHVFAGGGGIGGILSEVAEGTRGQRRV
jgi:hypothetical protein